MSSCSPRSIFAPLSALFGRSYFFGRRETWNGLAQAQKQCHRPWPSQGEELVVRLRLYRGCHEVELVSLRGGVLNT